MHEIFLHRYCMNWVPEDPQKNAQLSRQNDFSLT